MHEASPSALRPSCPWRSAGSRGEAHRAQIDGPACCLLTSQRHPEYTTHSVWSAVGSEQHCRSRCVQPTAAWASYWHGARCQSLACLPDSEAQGISREVKAIARPSHRWIAPVLRCASIVPLAAARAHLGWWRRRGRAGRRGWRRWQRAEGCQVLAHPVLGLSLRFVVGYLCAETVWCLATVREAQSTLESPGCEKAVGAGFQATAHNPVAPGAGLAGRKQPATGACNQCEQGSSTGVMPRDAKASAGAAGGTGRALHCPLAWAQACSGQQERALRAPQWDMRNSDALSAH